MKYPEQNLARLRISLKSNISTINKNIQQFIMKNIKEKQREFLKNVKIIREQINPVNQKYATTLQDEELDGYPSLGPQRTGLPYYMWLDNAQAYKYFNHPLCLYVYNQPGDIKPEGKLTPVTISDNPQVIGDNLFNGNDSVISFVRNNVTNLLRLADMEIDIGDFYDEYKNKFAYGMVDEMSILASEITGLPVKVYIDDTMTYKRSGHNQSYRFKYQQDKDINNPYLWMPVLIPSLEVKRENNKIPPRKVKQSTENMVLEWAKKNLDLLIKLGKEEIDGVQFKKSMIRFDTIDVILDSQINPELFKLNTTE